MIVRHLNEAKPYEAPNHRKYESLRIYGAEMGGSQTSSSASRTSSRVAGRGPTLRRRKKSTTFSRGS